MKMIKCILLIFAINITSCIALDNSLDQIDYRDQLNSLIQKYFPIRNSIDYIPIEDIRLLKQIKAPTQFTNLILGILKDKYIPPLELLPDDLGVFDYGYIQLEIAGGIKTEDEKMKIIKLAALMNKKFDADYLNELPGSLQVLYTIIVANKNSEYDTLIKEFLTSLPQFNLFILADFKQTLLYINLVCDNKSDTNTLRENGIDPDFYKLACGAFTNININNSKQYYNDKRLFPGLTEDLLQHKVERMVYYEKLVNLKMK